MERWNCDCRLWQHFQNSPFELFLKNGFVSSAAAQLSFCSFRHSHVINSWCWNLKRSKMYIPLPNTWREWMIMWHHVNEGQDLWLFWWENLTFEQWLNIHLSILITIGSLRVPSYKRPPFNISQGFDGNEEDSDYSSFNKNWTWPCVNLRVQVKKYRADSNDSAPFPLNAIV